MAISLITGIVWCLCIFTITPSAVRAAGGRIAFSGAVVVPSCNVATAESAKAEVTASGTQVEATRLGCAESGNATRTSSQVYARVVERLSSAVPDRVLKYFDAYVKASRVGAEDPVLLIQTYE